MIKDTHQVAIDIWNLVLDELLQLEYSPVSDLIGIKRVQEVLDAANTQKSSQ